MSRPKTRKKPLGRELLERTTVYVDVAQCIREVVVGACLLLAVSQATGLAGAISVLVSSIRGTDPVSLTLKNETAHKPELSSQSKEQIANR